MALTLEKEINFYNENGVNLLALINDIASKASAGDITKEVNENMVKVILAIDDVTDEDKELLNKASNIDGQVVSLANRFLGVVQAIQQ